MANAISIAAANAEGAALSALLNSGFLKIYTGTRPASPETGASGTLLVTFPLAATAMTWSSGTGTLGGVPLTDGAVAAGTPGWARFSSSGGTGVLDCDVGVGGTAWVALTVTALGAVVTNGANSYVCTVAGTTAASGGPTGTGTGITDGSVTWNYLGAAVSDGINLSVASVAAGMSITVSSFTYNIPSV